ncbi:MAG TPA: DUF6226 family protein [Vicinamibacterales bacterium]
MPRRDDESAPCGQVTNPERFSPLHRDALDLLDSLVREFDVERIERHGLDPFLEEGGVRRPSIRLAPPDGAAPLVVAFTGFPGLRVRMGRWCTAAFPACGCDACGETFEEEIARFRAFVVNGVEGRFTEALVRGSDGTTLVEWELWQEGARSRGRQALESAGSPAIRDVGDTRLRWGAWPRRRGA